MQLPLVKRVPRVDRQAVLADIASISVGVVGPFLVVAIRAQRLQRTEHKGVVIAAMSRVMVGDRRRREASSLAAQNAERIETELVSAPPSPALKRVPAPPRERLRRGEVSRGHGGEGLRQIGGLLQGRT